MFSNREEHIHRRRLLRTIDETVRRTACKVHKLCGRQGFILGCPAPQSADDAGPASGPLQGAAGPSAPETKEHRDASGKTDRFQHD
jgi:hypothetical protein